MRHTQKQIDEAKTNFIRDLNLVMEVLHYGELQLRTHGLPITAQGLIWTLCQDQMEIEARCTDKIIRWLRSAERAHMPEMVLSRRDIWEVRVSRLVNEHSPGRQVSGMSEYDPSRIVMNEPTDAELERMFIIDSWGQFIVKGKNPVLMQKCFRLLAGGAGTEYVHRKLRPGAKPNRQTVYDLRVRCCQWIVEGLMNEYALDWTERGFVVGKKSVAREVA